MKESLFPAPPERQDAASIERDRAIFARVPHFEEILNALPHSVLILNKERQVVFANSSFIDFIKSTEKDIIGHRPGEAVGCIHAYDRITGCGTSEFCRECGALLAVLASHENEEGLRECRVLRENLDALDLKIRAVPLVLEGRHLTIFSITDISAVKRQKALEKACFHDINNLQSILCICAESLSEHVHGDAPAEATVRILSETVMRLGDEMRTLLELTRAESSGLDPFPVSTPGSRILREVCEGALTPRSLDSCP